MQSHAFSSAILGSIIKLTVSQHSLVDTALWTMLLSERTVWRISRDSNGGGVSTPAPTPAAAAVDMSQWRHHLGPSWRLDVTHGYSFGPCYPGCGCEPRAEGAPTTPMPFWADVDTGP